MKLLLMGNIALPLMSGAVVNWAERIVSCPQSVFQWLSGVLNWTLPVPYFGNIDMHVLTEIPSIASETLAVCKLVVSLAASRCQTVSNSSSMIGD